MPFLLPRQRIFAEDVKKNRMYSTRYATQEQMAEYLGLSLNAYKNIEYGHIPKTGLFLLICHRLGLDPMAYLNDALLKVDRSMETVEDDLAGASL